MSTKKEIYYKFIFPDYSKLSGSDNDPTPTSDGVDQEGEVRTLCRECPERVITYDQLDADNPIAMYANKWDNDPSAPYSRDFIKRCVDKYLTIPKYFNLRNYWDKNICQEGGMSLMVSDSPEVGGDASTYTKFSIKENNSDVNEKIVYCAVMVSSGDFFYNFCLPEEVIKKSGLRDDVVRSRFHSNWYFNDNERVTYNNANYGAVKKLSTDYPKQYWGPGEEENEYTPEQYINHGYPDGRGYKSAMNPHFGQEKRVFVQHYFAYPGFNYVYQAGAKGYINFRDSNNNIYQVSDVYYRDENGNKYNQSEYFDSGYCVLPDTTNASYIKETLINTNNTSVMCDVQTISVNGTCGYFLINGDTPVTRYKYIFKDDIVHSRKVSGNTYYYIKLVSPLPTSGATDLDVALYFNIEEYRELVEDLKRDFVDLEVTRRILYYCDNANHSNCLNYYGSHRSFHPTKDIPTIINPSGISWTGTGPSADLNTFMHTAKGDAHYLDPLNPSQSGSKTVLSYERPDEYKDAAYTCNYTTYNYDSSRQKNVSQVHSEAAHGTPPLQIPYHLLRYCLNDRPPFTDCETVLVMWVATPYMYNGNLITPDKISADDPDKVKKLHNLNWEQYAIPISCRCCFKNYTDRDSFIQNHQGSHKHIHNRFLVEYPCKWNLSPSTDNVDLTKSHLDYKFHTRRSETYHKSESDENIKFREVLYLQDLISYSSDNVIVYQNSDNNYIMKGFDIQGYLFKKYPDAFKKLYILKKYMDHPIGPSTMDPDARGQSMNLNGQIYYIRVNKTGSNGSTTFFNIDSSYYDTHNICFRNATSTGAFVPSDVIYRKNVNGDKWDPTIPYGSVNFIRPSGEVSILGETKNWDFDDVNYYETYGYNDWEIDDTRFIALFDAKHKDSSDNFIFNKEAHTLTLTNHEALRNTLNSISSNWNNIYISSIGVTYKHPLLIDSMFEGVGSFMTCCPLGILDGHIELDDIPYGSTVNGKIVAGFENMLDSNLEDLYHFKWNGSAYVPVKTTFDYHNDNAQHDELLGHGFSCTAYIMNYTVNQ